MKYNLNVLQNMNIIYKLTIIYKNCKLYVCSVEFIHMETTSDCNHSEKTVPMQINPSIRNLLHSVTVHLKICTFIIHCHGMTTYKDNVHQIIVLLF